MHFSKHPEVEEYEEDSDSSIGEMDDIRENQSVIDLIRPEARLHHLKIKVNERYSLFQFACE